MGVEPTTCRLRITSAFIIQEYTNIADEGRHRNQGDSPSKADGAQIDPGDDSWEPDPSSLTFVCLPLARRGGLAGKSGGWLRLNSEERFWVAYPFGLFSERVGPSALANLSLGLVRHHRPALHHPFHLMNHDINVCQWIAFDGDQVCKISRRYRA